VYTSASEIGTKMSSRQCLLELGVGVPASFNVSDAPDFCRMANEAAYQYALDHASPATKARFAAHGQPYTFGPDLQKSGGPLFLDAGITYADEGDAGVRIQSPAQKTDRDYWAQHFPFPRPSFIPDPGCFHYCKLLSPARAMEWVYVDGLRRHLPLEPTDSATRPSRADKLTAAKAREQPDAQPPAAAEKPADEKAAAANTLAASAPAAQAAEPCCKVCELPKLKFYSVDVPHGFCGECCMQPDHFWLFHIFEANLTATNSSTPCSEQFTPTGTHYTEYSQTVTHGVWPITMTLDLYAPGPAA